MSLLKIRKARKKKRVLGLVFDIGSGSVAGSIVVLEKDQTPKILYTVRKPIAFQKELNFERFVQSMFDSFTVVLDSIQKKGLGYLNAKQLRPDAISHVLFTYASPWYTAHTKILTIEKKESFTVTQNLINKLLKKEDAGENATHGSVVEQSITSIKLNGYSVHTIENKETKELELTVSTTLLPESITKSLEELLMTHFHQKYTAHHSFPFAMFTLIRDAFQNTDTFTVVDVSGEVTDVSLIKNGALLETLSFPKGRNYITRRMMQELGLSPVEARSLERMFGEQATTLTHSDKADEAMARIQDEWVQAFRKTLQKLEKDLELPGALFFIADQEFLPIVRVFIEEAGVENTIDAQSIGYTILRGHVDFSSSASRDLFVGIGGFFLNKIVSL